MSTVPDREQFSRNNARAILDAHLVHADTNFNALVYITVPHVPALEPMKIISKRCVIYLVRSHVALTHRCCARVGGEHIIFTTFSSRLAFAKALGLRF